MSNHRFLKLSLLLVLLSLHHVQASPWSDELLFEYRKNGELKSFEFYDREAIQVQLAHPLWRSALGFFNSLGLKREELTAEYTARNLAIYFGPWRTSQGEGSQLRYRTRLLLYRSPTGGTEIYLSGQICKRNPETQDWEDVEAGLRSTGEALYKQLALGLTFARYPDSPELITETLKLARAETRRSGLFLDFLPPTSPSEPPEKLAALAQEEPSTEMMEKERELLSRLLSEEVIKQKEFDVLDEALKRLEGLN